jgi:hypothetical protein
MSPSTSTFSTAGPSSSTSTLSRHAWHYEISCATERPGAWSRQNDPTLIQTEIPYNFERATLWPDNGVLLAANTEYLPAPPRPESTPVYVGKDGYWGASEYSLEPQPFDHLSPHLAFLPIPRDAHMARHILFRQASERDWTLSQENDKKGLWVMSEQTDASHVKPTLADLYADLVAAMDAIGRVFPPSMDWKTAGRRDMLFSHFRFPNAAIAMAYDACAALRRGVKSQAIFQLYWRAMQRGAREMLAVVPFCKTFLPKRKEREFLSEVSKLDEYAWRGSVFIGTDADDYYGLFVEHGVPAYAVIWRKQFRLSDADPRLYPPNERHCITDTSSELSK